MLLSGLFAYFALNGANASITAGVNTFAIWKNLGTSDKYTQLTSEQFSDLWPHFKAAYANSGGIAVYDEFKADYCSMCFSDGKRLDNFGEGNLLRPGNKNGVECENHFFRTQLCSGKNACYSDSNTWAEPTFDNSSYCGKAGAIGIFARNDFIDAVEEEWDNFEGDDNALDCLASNMPNGAFVLGPANDAISGYEIARPQHMDAGLWDSFKNFYEDNDGISTHHAFISKYCSICLKDSKRLFITYSNQSKGPTVPGQNGEETCKTNEPRDGKYDLCSYKKSEGCFNNNQDNIVPYSFDDEIYKKSSYCRKTGTGGAQSLYVDADWVAKCFTSPKDITLKEKIATASEVLSAHSDKLQDEISDPRLKAEGRRCADGSCNCSGNSAATNVVYFRTTKNLTWQQGKELCADMGLKMATARTSAENSVLSSNQPNSWIGGRRYSERNYWQWVWDADTKKISSTFWNNGEPNNAGGESCLQMYSSSKWNDLGCHRKLRIVCEQRHCS